MIKFKSLISFILFCTVLTMPFYSVNGSGIITDCESDTIEHFKVSHSPANGNCVKNENGKLKFEFSEKISDSSRTSYVNFQKIKIKNNMCFDFFMQSYTPDKVYGSILLRNYYISGGFYDIIKFSDGKMKFVTGGESDIPRTEFRIKITITGDVISIAINGETVSSGEISPIGILSPEFELRAEFSDVLNSKGEALNIFMDDIKLVMDSDCDGIYTEDISYYVDYGRERIRKEKVLDPFESLTAKMRVANLGSEETTLSFIDRENIEFDIKTLAPGEIKTFNIKRYDGNVEKWDKREFLLWTDGENITPIIPKQRILNDGVVIPDIDECKQMFVNIEGTDLWISKKQQDQIKKYLDKTCEEYDVLFNKIWNDIKSEGNSLIGNPPIEYGNNLGVQSGGRIYYNIALWSTLFKVTGDTKYHERILKEMENAASFPDWHNEHFLDTAAVLCGMAIGYDTIKDVYPLKTENLAKAIYEKGISTALSIYRYGNDTWDTRETNWNIICNSAVAMASLCLGADNKYTEDCAEAFNTALRNLRIAFGRFTEQGSWYEGVGYCGYMMTYAVDLFKMLSNAFETNFGYDEIPSVLNFGYSSLAMGGTYSYNHDDSERGRASSSPGYMWISEKTGNPELGKYHLEYLKKEGVKGTFRDVLYYNPQYDEGDISKLKKDFCDNELKLVSFRDNFSDNTYLAFNAGSNLSSHSHLDMGSFVYDSLGTRWFEDLGTDSYDLWHYLDYNAYKWYYYRNRAEGHNCTVFDTGRFDGENPSTAPDQVVDSEGNITQCVMSDDFSWAKTDITNAYTFACSRFNRSFFFDKTTGAMAVYDSYDISCDNADTYFFAHTMADRIEINENDNSAVMTINDNGEDKRLYVKIIGDSGKLSVMDAKPLLSSPDPDKFPENISSGNSQNKNNDFKKLSVYENKTNGEHELLFVAIPYEKKGELESFVAKINEINNRNK